MSGFDFGLTNISPTINIGWGGALLGIIIIAVTAIAITRNTKHLRMILFPLTLGYSIIGLNLGQQGGIIYAILITVFALVWGLTIGGRQAWSAISSTTSWAFQAPTRIIYEGQNEGLKKKYGLEQKERIESLRAAGGSAKQIEEAIRNKEARRHERNAFKILGEKSTLKPEEKRAFVESYTKANLGEPVFIRKKENKIGITDKLRVNAGIVKDRWDPRKREIGRAFREGIKIKIKQPESQNIRIKWRPKSRN